MAQNNNNTNLHSAKSIKDDEFYTTYEEIQKELPHYKEQFHGKIVLCNCDDPFESNFCKFFIQNFNNFHLKKLICTSYLSSTIAQTELQIPDVNPVPQKGSFVIVNKVTDSIFDVSVSIWHSVVDYEIGQLQGDGDFSSPECVEFLKEADIVVTNPPFSLFRQFISLLVEHNKKFLVIGNMNAITYKEIFPLVQNNQVWLGYHCGDMSFRVPKDSRPRKTRFWVDESGQKWRSLGNAMWFTNLDVSYRHKLLCLDTPYDPAIHPHFDNFDAINVPKVAQIPYNFEGIMAVPLTILGKYNPDQFEIVGEANHGSDNPYDLFKPTIGGKEIFKRILIKKKKYAMTFRILDLFCGAGGFSYGIHKNPRFSTEVALDFNAHAAGTFKKNMPSTEVIIGDITDDDTKERVIALSRERGVNMIIGGPPCQGFSMKGKKLGLNDPRNFLFREYLNIVTALQPDIFVIENVKSLLSTSAGWFKNEIVSSIRSLGYEVEFGVLNAADFGVPQTRCRAIFICSKIGHVPLPVSMGSTVTVRDAIEDLSYLNSGEGEFEQPYSTTPTSEYQVMMRDGSSQLYNHKASKHKDIAIEKLSLIPPEKGKEFLPQEMLGKQRFKTTWGRLVWEQPSPTIDTRFDAASNGKNNHPFLNRAITPREAARIQSFDDSFIFLGSKVQIRQQIGNAVPPLLAKAIADQIDHIINNTHS